MCSNGTGQVGCGPQEEFRACADVAILDTSGEADETPYIPNEIDTEEVPTDTEKGEQPKEDSSEWWFLLIIIVLATLLLVLATFFFIYVYYYKKTAVKEWWEEKNLPVFHRSPRESRFWANLKEGNRFAFWKTDPTDPKATEVKNKNVVAPQPVPPPRTKRLSRSEEPKEAD